MITTTTRWDEVRESWLLYVETEHARADEECRGVLLRSDRRHEFIRKYGTDTTFLFGPTTSAVAYRYASEELRRYWEYRPRLTWPEFAVQSGLMYRDYLNQARRAPAARAAAALRAAA